MCLGRGSKSIRVKTPRLSPGVKTEWTLWVSYVSNIPIAIHVAMLYS